MNKNKDVYSKILNKQYICFNILTVDVIFCPEINPILCIITTKCVNNKITNRQTAAPGARENAPPDRRVLC